MREVDLASKVQADNLGGALARQGKRLDLTQLAVTGHLAIDQFKRTFPDVAKDRRVDALISAAPVVMLKGGPRGRGLGGYLGSPQGLGVLAIAGLVIAGELTRKNQEVSDVQITRFEKELDFGESSRFLANPLGPDGRVVGEKRDSIVWSSKGDSSIASVDQKGVVTAGQISGTVRIEAAIGDRFDQVTLRVFDGLSTPFPGEDAKAKPAARRG